MVKVVGMHKMRLLKFTTSSSSSSSSQKRNETRSSTSSYARNSGGSSTTSKILESSSISPSELTEASHTFTEFVIEAMKDRPSGVSHRKSLRRSKLVVLNMNAFEDCESYDLRLLSNGHLQFNSEEKKNIPFSEIRERFTETSKFVCDLYVSYHLLTHSITTNTNHHTGTYRFDTIRFANMQ